MDVRHEIIQETIHYEPGSQFLLHNNISAVFYDNHWHNAVELIMPIKNIYEVEVNYKPYTLDENDIIIIPSGELHKLNLSQCEGHRLILQFSVEMLNAIHGFINASYVYADTWLIREEDNPELHERIRALLTEILDEHLNQNDFYNVAITQKIIGITLYLTRVKRPESDTNNEDLSVRKKHIERLNECLEYIDRNYSEKLTLEGVAQSAGYSKYHFSRWFREYAGMPFIDYLTKVRVNKAEVLLIGSAKTMTEISLEAGFQSTNTFNRIFKKYNGCTPTEYRTIHTLKSQAATLRDYDSDQGDTVFTMKTPIPQGVPGVFVSDWLYRKNGHGAYENPVIWADIPDPDVIRVGETYYMTSTTMYFNPGIPVMKSFDLIHWEIVNYVYDILDSTDTNALRNGSHAYGKGSWASSLRYRSGTYYVSVCALNTGNTYIFQTEDIENGQWRRFELGSLYHDSSLLFDDDGRVYLVYGGGTIRIIELTDDATAVLPGGLNQVIIENADAGGGGGLPAEGSHIYKINGKYYLFLIAWPESGSKRRIELCYRADRIEGPYEGRVVLDDDMGYGNNGVAQGGIADTPQGDWFAMLFQDHGAVGRIPVLVPVTWRDGFPVFGVDGKVPCYIEPVITQKDCNCNIIAPDEFSMQNASVKHNLSDNGKESREQAENTAEHKTRNAAENTDRELLINNDFTSGTEHWDVMESADIQIVTDADTGNSPALFISGRTTTASGPRQLITGKVLRGGIYKAYARIKYVSGPPEKTFNMCIRNGSTWEGIRIIGTGKLTRGEWGYISGTYTIPVGADLSESSVFVETPWVEKAKKETDLMDFYVSYISVTGKPAVRYTTAVPGENNIADVRLALPWQWNHNPDNNLWSLTERPGFLRLKSAYLSSSLLDARNILTQRTFGPVCSAAVALETGGMNDGDVAGLSALQELYGFIGVKMTMGTKYIVMQSTASGAGHPESVHPHMLAGFHAIVPVRQQRVYLKVDFDFTAGIDIARFYYSLDEINWHMPGEPLHMQYRLSHFTGYRFGLFYYATQLTGGFADFDYFRPGNMLTENNKDLKVLSASFISDTQALGMEGTAIRASICMDPLPGDIYKGISISVNVPDLLDIKEVLPCYENICGSIKYDTDGNLLRVCVTGEHVSFSHNGSQRFIDIIFTVTRNVNEDTTVLLRPDYIYIDGGNVAYRTHEAYTEISVYAPETFTRGWKIATNETHTATIV